MKPVRSPSALRLGAVGTLGTSFGSAAGDYVAGRPGYLPDAVAWLLADVTGPVADVGAGTGKLTAEIASQGHDVTAVDPDPAMLEALRAAVPGVVTIAWHTPSRFRSRTRALAP